jgi:hypothetical protein
MSHKPTSSLLSFQLTPRLGLYRLDFQVVFEHRLPRSPGPDDKRGATGLEEEKVGRWDRRSYGILNGISVLFWRQGGRWCKSGRIRTWL